MVKHVVCSIAAIVLVAFGIFTWANEHPRHWDPENWIIISRSVVLSDGDRIAGIVVFTSPSIVVDGNTFGSYQ